MFYYANISELAYIKLLYLVRMCTCECEFKCLVHMHVSCIYTFNIINNKKEKKAPFVQPVSCGPVGIEQLCLCYKWSSKVLSSMTSKRVLTT